MTEKDKEAEQEPGHISLVVAAGREVAPDSLEEQEAPGVLDRDNGPSRPIRALLGCRLNGFL